MEKVRTETKTATRAILLAFNANNGKASYHAYHGGESVLGRSLVALSKSGFRSAVVATGVGRKEEVERLIGEVRHRLSLTVEVHEMEDAAGIATLLESTDEPFLLLETDKILHPTLLKQAAAFDPNGGPVLVCYRHVDLQNGAAQFDPALSEKYRVMFADTRQLTRVELAGTNGTMVDGRALERPPRIGTDVPGGSVSTEIAVFKPSQLRAVTGWTSFADLIGRWNASRAVSFGFANEAWWFKLHPDTSDVQLRELFWKIAFKEISGEFSKAVNSKFSKPLSLFLARKRVTPNAISSVQMLLFVAATAFLFIDAYWATLTFAVVWQFSAGVLDRCDGETARIRNHESEGGAKYDVLVDDLRFGLPFFALTWIVYGQSGHDLSIPITAGLTLLLFLTSAMQELRFMRSLGYQSRQVVGADIARSLGNDSFQARFFHTFRPFFKGDARTFMVFLISLSGNKTAMFWALTLNILFMGVQALLSIWKLRAIHLKLQ
jgi:phosphatidylglycerophosphate synthase